MARAAAAALDTGDVAQGGRLLKDALRGLGLDARPPLRVVESGDGS